MLKDKLEQIGTWQLFGNVESLQKVRFAGASTDAVLLSFKDAKVNFSSQIFIQTFIFRHGASYKL